MRKQLTQVRVRKPRPQEWIRVHPDPEYRARVATIVYKEDEEFERRNLSSCPSRRDELSDEITYHDALPRDQSPGCVFIWPCRDPNRKCGTVIQRQPQGLKPPRRP